MNEYAMAIEVIREGLDSSVQALAIQLSDDEKSLFEQFVNAYDSYLVHHSEVLRLSGLNSNVKAFSLATTDGRSFADQAERWLIKLTEKNDASRIWLLVDLERANYQVKLAAQISRRMMEMQRGEKNMIMTTQQRQMDAIYVGQFDTGIEIYNRLELMLQVFINENRGYQGATQLQQLNIEKRQQGFNAFRVAYKIYLSVHEEVRALSRLNSNVKALELSTGVGRTQFDTAQAILTSLVDTVDQEMSHSLVSANEGTQQARWLTYVISAVAALLAMVVIYTIIGGLIRRTKQLTQRAHIFHRMMRSSLAGCQMMN
jgi:methyl-accepting chemotaxis protein